MSPSCSRCTCLPTLCTLRMVVCGCRRTPLCMASWRSCCVHWRQLMVSPSLSCRAPANVASGDRPGSAARAAAGSSNWADTSISPSAASSGCMACTSLALRSSTRWPWWDSVLSSWAAEISWRSCWLKALSCSSALAVVVSRPVLWALRSAVFQRRSQRQFCPSQGPAACTSAWPVPPGVQPGVDQGCSRVGDSQPALAKLAPSAAALCCS